MTDTPDSTVTTPASLPVERTEVRHRPNRLYQALAWVGIVAGVLFIAGMVFFAGVFLGRTGGYGWHRGYHGGYQSGQMGPGGPAGQCPMMQGRGMGPGGMMGPSGMMGPGGMDPEDMGPGGMMPGRSPASTVPAAPPAQRPS